MSSLSFCVCNRSLVFLYSWSSSKASDAVFLEGKKGPEDAFFLYSLAIPLGLIALPLLESNSTERSSQDERLRGWADLNARIKAPTAAS